jgi:hypothetical protein
MEQLQRRAYQRVFLMAKQTICDNLIPDALCDSEGLPEKFQPENMLCSITNENKNRIRVEVKVDIRPFSLY